MTVREVIAFLERQNPNAIVVIDREPAGPTPPDICAGPGDSARRGVTGFIVEKSIDEESPTRVIFR